MVKVHQAKTTLSRLIARVLAGERVVIARDREPLVELVPLRGPVQPPGRGRTFGALRGAVAVGPEFFEPLPGGEIAPWES